MTALIHSTYGTSLLAQRASLTETPCGFVQDTSQAGRKLQQSTPATDARVTAQAADAATASTARSQLQDGVSNGKLAVRMNTHYLLQNISKLGYRTQMFFQS